MELVLLDVLRAIWSLRRDRGFIVLAVTAALLVVSGAAFYWVWENLSVLDSLYLSVMTLTTVGYGDVKPVTTAGKIFTMFFVIMGIGVLLAFLAAIASRLAARGEDVEPELPTAFGNGRYDVLVIGVDDSSRETALAAAKLGLRVVLVEEGHIQAGPVGSTGWPSEGAVRPG
jgi:voltage-gated potassium channel Kch